MKGEHMDENVLVIGGSSLFGRYLTPLLLKEGYNVTATAYKDGDEICPEKTEKFTGSHEGIKWIYMDVLDPESIKNAPFIPLTSIAFDVEIP